LIHRGGTSWHSVYWALACPCCTFFSSTLKPVSSGRGEEAGRCRWRGGSARSDDVIAAVAVCREHDAPVLSRGAQRALQILEQEAFDALGLLGAPALADLVRGFVVRRPDWGSGSLR